MFDLWGWELCGERVATVFLLVWCKAQLGYRGQNAPSPVTLDPKSQPKKQAPYGNLPSAFELRQLNLRNSKADKGKQEKEYKTVTWLTLAG